ncbi:YigZ family protein [Sutcliffiella sp. NC1]|uniref:YigZ family protein n=1 Tax=Sutcliffiella sp. NC1 TaxID=3004096 RepID=UPI0022DCE984|nr:YigZ family protein [Sutcliffiella sp. NC1]WBL14514.1 YigZ family protein [Sutcliffiella sp. NC1]
MLSHYYTVKEYGEHEISIQKSRFIAYINRATTVEEAETFIQDIKKKHWNATHNCSAYLIGENDQFQKANDDGEPSGTAGVPMLEVLKKKGLKDTVVVVTRYFGGVKLGAGGLVRAYGKAVSEGLTSIGIVERKLMRIMHTTIDYTLLGKVENELRNSHYSLKEIHYLENITIDTYVLESETNQFEEWMVNLTNGKADIIKGSTTYLETEL